MKQADISHDYDQLNIIPQSDDTYTVKSVKHDGYPAHSVLAGQCRIQFIDNCDSLAEAQFKYPDAELSHHLMMPHNTYDHLPDNDY